MLTVKAHKPEGLGAVLVLPASGVQSLMGDVRSALATTQYWARGVAWKVMVMDPSGFSTMPTIALVKLTGTKAFTTWVRLRVLAR